MAEPTPTDTPTMSAIPSGVASAAVSAVGTPQSMPPMDPEERTKSINVTLADLTAKATALYLAKNYEEAAEVFSQATEMQAELNGEMAPENADILFLYGRSLFKVGQSKSDVLGGKAPVEKKKPARADQPKAKKPQETTEAGKVAQEGVAAAVESAAKEAEKPSDDKKGLFQFTGDENWEDSDEEEENEEGAEGEEQEGEEEDEDDLAVAFEILDLSRVLFHKRIEELEAAEVTGEEEIEEREKIVRHIKERLAETHDLLAEISLENEKFPEAIKDCRSSLDYKLQLYPEDSELIAEAHFKLSLALEFASVTTTNEEGNDAAPKPVDEAMRKEAAAQLEKAIASTQLKLNNKEVELAVMHAPEDNDTTRKQITEVKELIADMEQRVSWKLPRLLLAAV
ncbi:hypothetical protein F5X96DRAFT_426296 [Biscogniauxia mediterranea]|nr:hypothetical protein F5X96DRAFT_426296 [Biscogniauxia mediterranea]